MDAQQLLAEFGHIANAPGGIDCLRALVLQLAAQGKLVGPSDALASSSEILDRVRETKAQLVAEKKLPREKPYPSEATSAAGGPQHWRWAHFGEVWQLLSGRDLGPTQYNETRIGIPYITGASNIENGAIAVNRWTPDPVVISTAGDLLITCKGTIGKTAFNNIGDVHIARQIMAIRSVTDDLDSRFLKIWLDG
jgi:type I restriction enzyme, S subunit